MCVHVDQGKPRNVLGHFGMFGTFWDMKVESWIHSVECCVVQSIDNESIGHVVVEKPKQILLHN